MKQSLVCRAGFVLAREEYPINVMKANTRPSTFSLAARNALQIHGQTSKVLEALPAVAHALLARRLI